MEMTSINDNRSGMKKAINTIPLPRVTIAKRKIITIASGHRVILQTKSVHQGDHPRLCLGPCERGVDIIGNLNAKKTPIQPTNIPTIPARLIAIAVDSRLGFPTALFSTTDPTNETMKLPIAKMQHQRKSLFLGTPFSRMVPSTSSSSKSKGLDCR